MKFERSSGIILHPTSLPGPYGIGDIGPEARAWVDVLAETGCKLWQVLPLGPTGYGDSPYQCFSAFAGNPYLISLDDLLTEDLLHPDDLVELPNFPGDRVDFGKVIPWKLGVLDRAYNRFQNTPSKKIQAEFEAFQAAEAEWLDDFALFMALKEAHGGAPWPTWEAPLRDHQPAALAIARNSLGVAIHRQVFRQFLFFRQWTVLHARAAQKGIRIIGDVPIFVAHDSADVWANPQLFFLDKKGNPTMVAGVPPDYFSPTGQLWGNPLYRWDVHATNGYAWWLKRLKAVLRLVDYIRLDHFRGFAGYWEIPAGLPTAEKGRWVTGPGSDFLTHVQQALGELPLIAEDLGVITPDVVLLRDSFQMPGMKILLFGFGFEGEPENKDLPHYFISHCVAYTGTHDNDTSRGWYTGASEDERDYCRRYLARDGRDIAWDFIRAVWSSVATFAIAPMQDILDLETEARMNFPGRPSGNWSWRMLPNAFDAHRKSRLREMNEIYARFKKPPKLVKEPEKVAKLVGD